jgi:transposase
MAAPITLREDFDAPDLRRLAKATKDAAQARRLLALAEIYNGGSRTDAARIGGVTLQIVRDWVLRFNSGGAGGLINRKAPGNRPKLNDEQRQALASMVESGPIPAIHGVVRWRRKDLARWIFEEFRIKVDETTVGRELRAMGFRKLSARPRHYAQNELEVDAFKKPCPPSWRRSRSRSRRAPTSNSGGMMKPESDRRIS